MSNKFRNLNSLMFKTYAALKYLEDNHIRLWIFFISDKDNDRFENF